MEEGSFFATVKSETFDVRSLNGSTLWIPQKNGTTASIYYPEQILMYYPDGEVHQPTGNYYIGITSQTRLRKGTYDISETPGLSIHFSNDRQQIEAFEAKMTIFEVTDETITGQFSMRGRNVEFNTPHKGISTVSGRFSAKILEDERLSAD
jgi:hypothetical protein